MPRDGAIVFGNLTGVSKNLIHHRYTEGIVGECGGAIFHSSNNSSESQNRAVKCDPGNRDWLLRDHSVPASVFIGPLHIKLSHWFFLQPTQCGPAPEINRGRRSNKSGPCSLGEENGPDLVPADNLCKLTFG